MVAAVKGLQWKIGMALVVIFLAGVGVGWVAGRRAITLRQLAMGRAEVWDGMILKRMEERLDLTAEQKATLAPMVRNTAEKIQAQRRRAMLEQLQAVRGLYRTSGTPSHAGAERAFGADTATVAGQIARRFSDAAPEAGRGPSSISGVETVGRCDR